MTEFDTWAPPSADEAHDIAHPSAEQTEDLDDREDEHVLIAAELAESILDEEVGSHKREELEELFAEGIPEPRDQVLLIVDALQRVGTALGPDVKMNFMQEKAYENLQERGRLSAQRWAVEARGQLDVDEVSIAASLYPEAFRATIHSAAELTDINHRSLAKIGSQLRDEGRAAGNQYTDAKTAESLTRAIIEGKILGRIEERTDFTAEKPFDPDNALLLMKYQGEARVIAEAFIRDKVIEAAPRALLTHESVQRMKSYLRFGDEPRKQFEQIIDERLRREMTKAGTTIKSGRLDFLVSLASFDTRRQLREMSKSMTVERDEPRKRANLHGSADIFGANDVFGGMFGEVLGDLLGKMSAGQGGVRTGRQPFATTPTPQADPNAEATLQPQVFDPQLVDTVNELRGRGASDKQIRAEIAKNEHPDVASDAELATMAAINNAYDNTKGEFRF